MIIQVVPKHQRQMIHCPSKVDSLDSRWFICWMCLFASNVLDVFTGLGGTWCCVFEISIPTTLKMIRRSFLIESRVAQQQVQNSKRISWAQPSACAQPKPPRGVTLLVDLLDFCAWFIPEVCGCDWSESEMLWSRWIHSSFLSISVNVLCILVSEKGSSVKAITERVVKLSSFLTVLGPLVYISEPRSWSFCGNSRRFRCCFMWNGRLPPQSRNVELLLMIPQVFHLGLFFWVEKTDQKNKLQGINSYDHLITSSSEPKGSLVSPEIGRSCGERMVGGQHIDSNLGSTCAIFSWVGNTRAQRMQRLIKILPLLLVVGWVGDSWMQVMKVLSVFGL